MPISARNQIDGTIKSIKRGPVNSEVIVSLAGDQTVVAIITLESVKRLNLKKGMRVKAVIKASDVMIAVD